MTQRSCPVALGSRRTVRVSLAHVGSWPEKHGSGLERILEPRGQTVMGPLNLKLTRFNPESVHI